MHVLHLLRFERRCGGERYCRALADALAASRQAGTLRPELVWLGVPAVQRDAPAEEEAPAGPPPPVGPAETPPPGDWDLAYVMSYPSKRHYLKAVVAAWWRRGSTLAEAALADRFLLATVPVERAAAAAAGARAAPLAVGPVEVEPVL